MTLFLVDNKSNIVCLSIPIFKKPNVNGTLERTKSAPGEGKSAQNKTEEKKIILLLLLLRAREKIWSQRIIHLMANAPVCGKICSKVEGK